MIALCPYIAYRRILMIKVLMHGCNGKMGQVVSRMVDETEGMELAAGVDRFLGRENPYPVFESVEACDVPVDVVIDFSNAAAVDDLLEACAKKGLPVVLCTTGLSEEQIAKVKKTSEKVAVLRSANMSLGVNTVFKLAAIGAQVLAQAGYDIEIVEKHHNQKLDAPSGTALAIADAINEVLNKEYVYKLDRSQERKKREKKEIGIQAVRGGNIVGEHEVFFCGPDEVIEIKHTAYSKGIFGKGAIAAAVYLKGKAPGMYTMSDVID